VIQLYLGSVDGQCYQSAHCYSWCTGHDGTSRLWLGDRVRDQENITGGDCRLILLQKPGKTDPKSETSLLIRLTNTSE